MYASMNSSARSDSGDAGLNRKPVVVCGRPVTGMNLIESAYGIRMVSIISYANESSSDTADFATTYLMSCSELDVRNNTLSASLPSSTFPMIQEVYGDEETGLDGVPSNLSVFPVGSVMIIR